MQSVNTRRTSVFSERKNVPTSNYCLLFEISHLPALLDASFLINLSMTTKHLQYLIQISREAQLDIRWWRDFLPIATWSGSSLIQDTH